MLRSSFYFFSICRCRTYKSLTLDAAVCVRNYPKSCLMPELKIIFYQTLMSAGREVGVSMDVRTHLDRLDVHALLDTDWQLMAELVWVSVILRVSMSFIKDFTLNYKFDLKDPIFVE